jgi:metal-responsive CopG/Arc/MetJ family transcriptional regulator
MKIKTITFSLPVEMGKDIEEMAQEEQRTVSELIREAIRQYRVKQNFRSLSKDARSTAIRKKLKPEDLGGSFED